MVVYSHAGQNSHILDIYSSRYFDSLAATVLPYQHLMTVLAATVSDTSKWHFIEALLMRYHLANIENPERVREKGGMFESDYQKVIMTLG